MPSPRAFARNTGDNERLLITAIDGFKGEVRAHYNPKEISLEKTVTWAEQKSKGRNQPYYEYTAGAPRTMTMELFFDVAEIKGATIGPELEVLQRMTLPLDPESKNDADRRPPLLELRRGPIENFRCVMESLIVKVTMFDRAMQPVRATATVKFKEVGDAGEKGRIKPNNAKGGASRAVRDGSNWQAADKNDIDAARAEAMMDRTDVDRAHRGQAPMSQRDRDLNRDLE